MDEWLLANEMGIRLGAFGGVLAAMVGWEVLAPRRPRSLPRGLRWGSNLALVALNSVILRLLFPAAAVGMAVMAEERGWGFLQAVDTPFWAEVVVGVVFLDFVVYLQHVLFHAVPALWRLHRVHHVDLDFDVTTGLRFHPIEIVLSMLLKFAAIAAIGAPVVAVLLFEVLLNATSMFNHGNVRIPVALDRVLRWVVVTPEMHRVHHSVHPDETNRNFGFNLPWWDRLLGTYRPQPRDGHEGMTIGLKSPREPEVCARLPQMLWLPFHGRAGGGIFPGE